MPRERLEDLSVYYYVKDLFEDTTFINVEDGFPQTTLSVPTIAVDAKKLDAVLWELGNTKRAKIRSWSLDVFAQTKSQRDDIGYTLLDALETCIPVYDYNEGFPPETTPTQIGCLKVDTLKMEIVSVLAPLVEKLYWRSRILFTAQYDQL